MTECASFLYLGLSASSSKTGSASSIFSFVFAASDPISENFFVERLLPASPPLRHLQPLLTTTFCVYADKFASTGFLWLPNRGSLKRGQSRDSVLGSSGTLFTFNLHFPPSLFLTAQSFILLFISLPFVHMGEMLRGFISGTQCGRVAAGCLLWGQSSTRVVTHHPDTGTDWSVITVCVCSSPRSFWPPDLTTSYSPRNNTVIAERVSRAVGSLVVFNQPGRS